MSDGRAMREKIGEKDAEGFAVENFGLPLNLMLCGAARIVAGNFAAALAVCASEQA